MAIIEIDPRVQAMFDDNVARTRRATDEVASTLRAEQGRIAAEARQMEEKFAADRAAMRQKSEELAKAGTERRGPGWERGETFSGELAFGPEDDDQPAPPPPIAQPATRRPAPRDDDGDDLTGRTWLT